MAEAAGLALAGVSLAFQVFSGCVQAFTMLQDAQNLGKDASAIRCMLAWAEYRLVSRTLGPIPKVTASRTAKFRYFVFGIV